MENSSSGGGEGVGVHVCGWVGLGKASWKSHISAESQKDGLDSPFEKGVGRQKYLGISTSK